MTKDTKDIITTNKYKKPKRKKLSLGNNNLKTTKANEFIDTNFNSFMNYLLQYSGIERM